MRDTDGLSAAVVIGQTRRTWCDAALMGAAPGVDSRRKDLDLSTTDIDRNQWPSSTAGRGGGRVCWRPGHLRRDADGGGGGRHHRCCRTSLCGGAGMMCPGSYFLQLLLRRSSASTCPARLFGYPLVFFLGNVMFVFRLTITLTLLIGLSGLNTGRSKSNPFAS